MGELLPLPILDRPFSHITMDFITDLSLSSEEAGSSSFNSILVVMNCHTKMVHYTATRKSLMSARFAELLLRDMIKLHRVPEQIVSDRGSLFTSDFWKTLTKLLGADHHLSTAFHP